MFFNLFFCFEIDLVLVLVFLISDVLVRFRIMLNFLIPIWLLRLIKVLLFEVLVSKVIVKQVLFILLVQLSLLNVIFILIDLFLSILNRVFPIQTCGTKVFPLFNLTLHCLILSDDLLSLFFVVLYELFQYQLLLPFYLFHSSILNLFLTTFFC